ncbi:MAG: fibronectin type III domain-containing protein [Chthoniobacterales bacterium]|nr:fibronectin type III domain-containing protein [Chthoniobacterales bacterium]
MNPPDNNGATIKITVTDAAGASAASSFTLRKDSAVNPPVIAGIPNEEIFFQSATTFKYGPVWFVVGDLDSAGNTDAVDSLGNSTVTFEMSSDNTNLVPSVGGIDVQPVEGIGGRAQQVTVSPKFPQTGRAVITITAIDHPDLNRTSTSFVLDVIAATNTAPSFTPPPINQNPHPSWLEQDVTQSPTAAYVFKVTDSETPKPELLVTAVSSNAALVPNTSANLSVGTITSGGTGTLTITPLPLPSPAPGVPQASTITLSVTDSAYTRRTQFLYVAKNSTSPALKKITRPAGIYNLDPKPGFDQQRPDDQFLTGEMHRISWKDIDNGDPDPNNWNWQELDDAVANLPAGQDLSLNLIGEPCYILQHQGVVTWCDTAPPNGQDDCPASSCVGGVNRAVPWDFYLQARRDNFYQALAGHLLPTGRTVAQENLIPIINPNLPGGDTGIRELDGQPFSATVKTGYTYAPGYTRSALFGTVRDELDKLVTYFSAKQVQIGFFTVEDDLGGVLLWQYLYPKLRDRYNGVVKPKVHFFLEDLAASRASAAPDFIPYTNPPSTKAYTLFPMSPQVPSFAYYPAPDNLQYQNGITFQANTPWSAPVADGDKVDKTLNGTPNDGLEAAFNAYLCEYLEVYREDLDHAKPPTGTPAAWDAAKWAAGLQSWHDYTASLRSLAPTESPAGLTVARTSSTNNSVNWYAPYGATSYTLQRRSLSPLGDWTNVTGCDPLSTTCTDTASTGSQYAYRVQAANAARTILSPWAQVAVFLSEGTNDGYVSATGQTYTAFANVAGPGIQAGQGAGTDLSGFLSFNTSSLGSAATILDVNLRLKQYSSNEGFDSLGPCIADIQTGDFHDKEKLEGADFDAPETDFDVTEEGALAGVDPENWVEAELDPVYASDVNNTDRTQFRLWFEHVEGLSDKSVQWYSSESPGNEPQLIVQYSEE